MRKHRLLRATMVATCVLAAGCDSWLSTPSLYNTVQVTVTQPNGAPIPDVSLELYTGLRPMGYGTTDANGAFTFTRVPQGGYGVVAYAWPTGFDAIAGVGGGLPSNVAELNVCCDSVPPVHLVLVNKG